MTGPKHESQRKTVLGSKDRDEPVPHKRYCYQGDQDRITGWGDTTVGLKGHDKRSVFELRGTWPELCFYNLDLAIRRAERQENSAHPP